MSFAVTNQQRGNFTTATPSGLAELDNELRTRYFPSWYSGVDMDGFCETAEGQAALKNHLYFRLEVDRYEFIPWVSSVLSLRDAHVLEIGCGTGSAAVSVAEQGARVTALDVHAEALAVAERRAEVKRISIAALFRTCRVIGNKRGAAGAGVGALGL